MYAIVAAFLAGLLTIFSPCVLPLAPIVVASARARDPRGPLALALGLALAFGIAGGNSGLGRPRLRRERRRSACWRRRSYVACRRSSCWLPALRPASEQPALAVAGALAATRFAHLPAAGLAGAFAAGVVLAFAWAPCVGPTLGAAFALAAAGGSLVAAMATMTSFAAGAALRCCGAGYCLSRMAAANRTMAGRGAAIGKKALAVTLVVVGISIFSGLDKSIEATFVEAMPDGPVIAATRL